MSPKQKWTYKIQESHGTPTRTNPKNHTGTYYFKRWEGGSGILYLKAREEKKTQAAVQPRISYCAQSDSSKMKNKDFPK